VPEEKIVARYDRSIQQLPWFLERADSATIFDNSGPEPMLMAEKKNGELQVDKHALRAIQDIAQRLKRI
jgi:predicted ABC-type ATPase